MTFKKPLPLNELTEYVSDFKKRTGSRIYDVHVHASEVFDLSGNIETKMSEMPNSPSLLEKFDYSPFSLFALDCVYKVAPAYIKGEVAKNFSHTSENSLGTTIAANYVDRAIILPRLKEKDPAAILAEYMKPEYIRLGTIYPHNTTPAEVEKYLDTQVKKYAISGIKLHPNVQSFYPDPSRNDSLVRDSIRQVYQYAEEHKLFLLFHGGTSYVPVGRGFQKVEYGLLDNFFDVSGHSEVLELNIPIIIAHLGSYGVSHPDFSLLEKITKKYSNILFDMAGVSMAHIVRYAQDNGWGRILFGSDAPYFNQQYALWRFISTVERAVPASDVDEVLMSSFCRIIEKRVL